MILNTASTHVAKGCSKTCCKIMHSLKTCFDGPMMHAHHPIPPPDPIHRIDTHATILFDITEYYHLIPTPSYSSPTLSLAMTSQPALISTSKHSGCPFSAAR